MAIVIRQVLLRENPAQSDRPVAHSLSGNKYAVIRWSTSGSWRLVLADNGQFGQRLTAL